MFCSKCGIKLPEGCIFCSRCGTQLGAAPTPQPYGGVQQPSLAPGATMLKVIGIIFMVWAGIVLLSLLIYFFFMSGFFILMYLVNVLLWVYVGYLAITKCNIPSEGQMMRNWGMVLGIQTAIVTLVYYGSNYGVALTLFYLLLQGGMLAIYFVGVNKNMSSLHR